MTGNSPSHFKAQHQGIRPALGYPACPDHTEKEILWERLEPDTEIGLTLTESKAVVPTAAVSGVYFAHPESRYFALGCTAKVISKRNSIHVFGI